MLPPWARNGSFLVFRRLAQDVKGFRDSVAQIATTLGITPDLLGAKLVGRYRSGAPLEALRTQAGIGEYRPPLTDPGVANPALANSNSVNNFFEYGKTKTATSFLSQVTFAKPIRAIRSPNKNSGRLNPRPRAQKAGRKRIGYSAEAFRFGKSLNEPEGGKPEDPRGLLFFAYQSDIERQFEFVQKHWVDDPNFPSERAGQDPIITNDTADGEIKGCPFHEKADASKCPVSFKHFVKTRGGQYFFSPAIDTLGDWLKRA